MEKVNPGLIDGRTWVGLTVACRFIDESIKEDNKLFESAAQPKEARKSSKASSQLGRGAPSSCPGEVRDGWLSELDQF